MTGKDSRRIPMYVFTSNFACNLSREVATHGPQVKRPRGKTAMEFSVIVSVCFLFCFALFCLNLIFSGIVPLVHEQSWIPC